MITVDDQSLHVNGHSDHSQRIAAGPQKVPSAASGAIGLVSPKTGGPYTGASSSSSVGSISSDGHLHKASPSDIIFGTPAGSDPTSRAAQSLATSPSSLCGSDHAGRASSRSRSRSRGQTQRPRARGGPEAGDGSVHASSVGSSSHLPPTPEVAAEQSAAKLAPTSAPRPDAPDVKVVPFHFEDSYPDDIVVLVADMLGRLVAHNDHLPLHPSSLTRFHSRTPPGISIASYLRRIARYTSLEKACTLIILVYIDRVCESLKGFTICSLTVHRFTCAAVVCACKALCDAFSTNGHYARVGGISLVELNMLEREFLDIIGWRLTCSGALLQHYYVSLVRSHPSYALADEPDAESGDEAAETETRGRQGKDIEPTTVRSHSPDAAAPPSSNGNGYSAMPQHHSAARTQRNASASRERGRDRDAARSRSRSKTGRSRSVGAKVNVTGGMVARMPRKRRRRREEGEPDVEPGNSDDEGGDAEQMDVDEGEESEEDDGRSRRSVSKDFAGMEIDEGGGEEGARGRSEAR